MSFDSFNSRYSDYEIKGFVVDDETSEAVGGVAVTLFDAIVDDDDCDNNYDNDYDNGGASGYDNRGARGFGNGDYGDESEGDDNDDGDENDDNDGDGVKIGYKLDSLVVAEDGSFSFYGRSYHGIPDRKYLRVTDLNPDESGSYRTEVFEIELSYEENPSSHNSAVAHDHYSVSGLVLELKRM